MLLQPKCQHCRPIPFRIFHNDPRWVFICRSSERSEFSIELNYLPWFELL